jgi:hypothetical protein
MGLTGRMISAAVPGLLALLATVEAHAANGAYAVDAADISETGSCKIESWLSSASNADFSAVANPSCVVDLFKPVELSLLANQSRSDGEWSTALQSKSQNQSGSDWDRKVWVIVLFRRLFRRADRRKSRGFCGGAGDLSAFRNHAGQHQCRLALGSHARPALFDLRHRLRLEIHRGLAMDH